jgi:hypothetical protein
MSSVQLHWSTFIGSGVPDGAGVGAGAVPKKTRAPSREKASVPFALGVVCAGNPGVARSTALTAAGAAVRRSTT